MGRVLRPLGCFGSTLLAILFVLGVTETLKYVGPLERVAGHVFLVYWIRKRETP